MTQKNENHSVYNTLYNDKNTFSDPNNVITRASGPVFSDKNVFSVKRSQDLPSSSEPELSSLERIPKPPPDPGERQPMSIPGVDQPSHKRVNLPLQTVPAMQAIIHVDGTDNCDMRPFFTD